MSPEPAEVIELFPEEYRMVVRTFNSHRELKVDIASPLASNQHAGGAHFMPELGSVVYVIPYLEDHGIVLAYTVSPERSVDGGNFRGGRPVLAPGDLVLSTKSGNGLVVASSGMVRLMASDLCGRIMVPLGGLVQDHFLRWRALSPMGSLEWTSSAVLDGSDVDSPNDEVSVLVRQQVKALAQDAVAEVDISYGNLVSDVVDTDADPHMMFANAAESTRLVEQTSAGRISVVVRSQEGVSKYAFQVNGAGDAFSLVSNFELHVAQEAHVVLGSRGTLEFGTGRVVVDAANAAFQALVEQAVWQVVTALTVNAGSLSANVGGVSAEVTGGKASVEGNVIVGSEPSSAAVVTNKGDLLARLQAHTHVVLNALPANPAQPVLAVSSTELLGLLVSASSKLKAQ